LGFFLSAEPYCCRFFAIPTPLEVWLGCAYGDKTETGLPGLHFHGYRMNPV